jgi:conjugative transfer signal peptidase TraF
MRRFQIHTATPLVVMAMMSVLVLVVRLSWSAFGPTILINGTPSEPVGFYRLVGHAEEDYRRGMFVVFPVPKEVREFVYGRHWLRDGVPLLKQLRGLTGDRVCIYSDRLEINGERIGPVFRVDSAGLPLPQHQGCFEVEPGSFFVASEYLDKSFDGRYFGALPLHELLGEARPIWTF